MTTELVKQMLDDYGIDIIEVNKGGQPAIDAVINLVCMLKFYEDESETDYN